MTHTRDALINCRRDTPVINSHHLTPSHFCVWDKRKQKFSLSSGAEKKRGIIYGWRYILGPWVRRSAIIFNLFVCSVIVVVVLIRGLALAYECRRIGISEMTKYTHNASGSWREFQSVYAFIHVQNEWKILSFNLEWKNGN